MLPHTSPRCIILMLSRYWLQSWPAATCSHVLHHVIKQCWNVLHHAGPYYYQGNYGAVKCTDTSYLFHFYCHSVQLWLLHAVIWLLLQSFKILLSVGAYGCTLTHSACWRIPVHPQQLLVYGDAPRAPRGHYTHHFCQIMFAPNSAPPYFIIISCPVSLCQAVACHAASYHTTFYLIYVCFYCYTRLMHSLLIHFISGCYELMHHASHHCAVVVDYDIAVTPVSAIDACV